MTKCGVWKPLNRMRIARSDRREGAGLVDNPGTNFCTRRFVMNRSPCLNANHRGRRKAMNNSLPRKSAAVDRTSRYQMAH